MTQLVKCIKYIIFIPMGIIESCLLILCFLLSYINNNLAIKLLMMCDKLPGYNWYFGKPE